MKKLTISLAFCCLVASAFGAAPAPFRIALLYPSETEGNKSIGAEMRCLSMAYLAEKKKTSPLAFEYEFFDNERDPIKTAVRASEIAKKGFDAIVGTTNSSEALAAKRALGTSEIPLITPTASHPDVTGAGGMVVSLAVQDGSHAKGLAGYLLREIKPKRLVIVKNLSMPYSIFLADRVSEEISKSDPKVKVVIFTYLDGSNFTPGLVKEIDSTDADVVFLPLLAPDVAAVYVTLKARARPITLMGSDAVGGRPEFFASIGKTMPHLTLRYTGQWDNRLHGKFAASFGKLHAKHCKAQDPSMVAVTAFDALNVLFETVARDPRLRGKALVNEILAHPYEGVLGSIRFTATQNAERALSVFEIAKDEKVWRGYLP